MTNSTTRKAHWVAAAVLTAGLAACNSNDAEEPDVPPIPEDDVAYIDTLVPHHQDAIEMADHVISRGTSAEMKAMAEQMKADQAAEIDLMLRIRRDIAGGDEIDAAADPHMESEMAEMATMSGHELEVMFLREMVPHHAGAVVSSHRALPNLTNQELRDLAVLTIDKQTREAAEMLDMLEAHGGSLATP
jgi:uncharacterized protein (DUF305 family)